MRYLVEPIGAQFANKALPRLAEVFSSHSAEGYELHTIFQVSQPGCLGIGAPSVTNLAVYVKKD